MSKQSEAKKRQNYNPKPRPAECRNCEYFTSDLSSYQGSYDKKTYWEEKNLRCSIGGFAVKKKGTCAEHKFED